MSTIDVTKEQLVELVAKIVTEEMSKKEDELKIPIGVSGRHVHLDRADMDILFGPGSELTSFKPVKQPGQFAAEQVVTIKGPKGEFNKVRVLGPLRSKTQVEISLADGFKLGVKAPIRESGHLEGTPGVELIGPAGSVKKDAGVIVALRHIHMTPDMAEKYGLKDRQIVKVEIGEEQDRGLILKNVLMRVTDTSALEMHIDQDEANAAAVSSNDFARIIE